MKLYKDYKKERERNFQEESDKQYLNAPDVVIIYEDGTGIGRFLLTLVFLLVAGLAVGCILMVFF